MSSDPFRDLSLGEALSRRSLLMRTGAGAALLAAGPVLAACGSDSSTTTTAAGGGGDVGGNFDLYTWQGYDATKVTTPWRNQNGVTLKANYVGAQDDVQVRVKSPTGAGIDMSTVNQSYNEYYEELGILSPITTEELPVLNDLFPVFSGAPWKNDDGSYNSIPFSFGWNGLAYSPERLKFKNPDSWEVLFDPSLRNRVAVWDDAFFSMQLAALIHGFNPEKLTQSEFETIKSWLADLRPQVKVFAPSIGDFVTVLGSGEVDAVYNAWSATPIFNEGDPVKAVIPKEGALGWLDAMFIPPNADNRATSLAWAEMLLGTKYGAEVQDELAGGATTAKVAGLLDKTTKQLYPYDDLDSLFEKIGLPNGFPRGDSEYVTADEVVAAWQEFKAG